MKSACRVLRIEDLKREDLPPKPLAVLGDPIHHSLSPIMHNAALAAMARRHSKFLDWRYYALEVPVDRLEVSVARLFALGFRGLNLTIPHKVEALDIVTSTDPAIAAMGAVNTLVADELGFRGTNTDGFGLSQAVQLRFGRRLGDSAVVLCGAGGAARAAAVQALREGAPALWIGNRGEENLSKLLLQLKEGGLDLARVRPFLFGSPPDDLPGNALLINATAAGLKAEDELPLDLDFLGSDGAVYDTTYGAVNAWSQWAEARGLPYADGLTMLVQQGRRSLEIWLGEEVPADVMLEAAQAALAQRKAEA